jgi:hypothetical protein
MSDTKFSPEVIGVNGTYTTDSGDELRGFAAQTAGTLTVVDSRGVSILTAFPVAAGTFTFLPFFIGNGATLTCAGGASGTAAIG